MHYRNRVGAGLAVVLLGTAFCLRGAAQPAVKGGQICPCTNQSPRVLGTATHSNESIVWQGPVGTVRYRARGSTTTWELSRCSQHYHPQLENRQPQCTMPPGSVEIHTVYSFRPRCIREDTSCCTQEPGTQQPVVVLAYQARVGGEARLPVSVFWGPPWAQWSGSTTGPDKPGEPCFGQQPDGACKPHAQWSFVMRCDLQVSQGQLDIFKHPEPARPIQPPSRLSGDLTLVP
jgi:hypothetical protein